jgi:putative membrane protein insertion efficiency factor
MTAPRTLAPIHRLLTKVVLAPVVLYRRVLSPLKATPSCRFLPTCSAYAIEAVERRGIFVGIALAIGRVLRCNPLFHGGYDPVPGLPPAGGTCAGHEHVHEGQV